MISKQTVYLNADRSKAVPEGDPSAQFLLVREGHDVDPALVEKYDGAAKLVGAGASEKKAEQSNEGPKPANREETLPKLRKRGKRTK